MLGSFKFQVHLVCERKLLVTFQILSIVYIQIFTTFKFCDYFYICFHSLSFFFQSTVPFWQNIIYISLFYCFCLLLFLCFIVSPPIHTYTCTHNTHTDYKSLSHSINSVDRGFLKYVCQYLEIFIDR